MVFHLLSSENGSGSALQDYFHNLSLTVSVQIFMTELLRAAQIPKLFAKKNARGNSENFYEAKKAYTKPGRKKFCDRGPLSCAQKTVIVLFKTTFYAKLFLMIVASSDYPDKAVSFTGQIMNCVLFFILSARAGDFRGCACARRRWR